MAGLVLAESVESTPRESLAFPPRGRRRQRSHRLSGEDIRRRREREKKTTRRTIDRNVVDFVVIVILLPSLRAIMTVETMVVIVKEARIG